MDEIDKLARQVARAPRDVAAITRLAQAVESATGRRVEVHGPVDAAPLTLKVARTLAFAGERIRTWLDLNLSHGLRAVTLSPENIAWMPDKERNCKINWSELAMHHQAQGADIVTMGGALTERDALIAAAVWVNLKTGTAGFIEGVGTEVFTPALDRYIRDWMR